jgi:hypothetical protein
LPELFDEESAKLFNENLNTPTTYSVITALAEGADRLVAEAIMEYDRQTTLEVVLPLTLADYKKTFHQPNDPKFNELLNKARYIKPIRRHNLESDFSHESTKGQSTDPKNLESARKEAYKKAGQHIVNHCDVLFAIWDGKESKGIGGTFEIIEYALSKKRPVIIISTEPPENIRLEKGYGLNCSALRDIEKFNNMSIPTAVSDTYLKNMSQKLFDHDYAGCLNESAKATVNQVLLPYYVKISYWAKKYQRRYKPSGVLIFSCSALAVSAILAGILYPPFLLAAFLIELICLLSIVAIYVFAPRLRKNWLEYRFLAERMRAACYFTAVNLEIPPIVIPPHMGSESKNNDWMILVFNEIWNKTPKMAGICDGHLDCCANYIRKNWIIDQLDHHIAKRNTLRKFNARFNNFGWIIYLIALIASIIHIIHNIIHVPVLSELLDHALIFLAIALPAVGAAVVGIHKHGEYERLENRSNNMTGRIEDILVDFQEVDHISDLMDVMFDFDELILLENQDWLMLMRQVKLEVFP